MAAQNLEAGVCRREKLAKLKIIKELFTPCVLLSFMGLTALVLIVFFSLKYKDKWQKPENCGHCRKDKNYHTLYISGYFALILLLMFAYNVVKQDDGKTVFEYFSFASVVVSIILAVLTIVYSYYTNSRSSGQAEKLGEASTQIEDASAKVLASADAITVNSRMLAENIDKILEKLDDVKGAADAAKEAATKAQANTDKQNLSRSADGGKPKSEQTDEERVANFLAKASYLGRYALLACVYSMEYNRTFTAEQISGDTGEYIFGFLIGAGSARLVDFDYNQGVFSVKFVDENMRKMIENFIENKIDQIDEKAKKEARKKELELVRNFFLPEGE